MAFDSCSLNPSDSGNQLSVAVEAHHHDFVFAGPHHRVDKVGGGVLLEAKAFADTVAGVDQNTDAQRQVGLGREFQNVLRLFGFEISKSSRLRSVTKRPFLSDTVNSMFTRLTSNVIREAASSSIGTCFG